MALSRTVAAYASPSANPTNLSAYNQAAGNCIVIGTVSYTGGGYATGVSDTANNMFVPVYAGTGYAGTGNMCCQIWYARNCLGNAANVVQIAYAGGAPSYAGAFYYDISGADLAAPMDAVFPGSVGEPRINVLAGLTTNFANELLLAFLGGNAGASLGYSVGSLTEHATFAANPLTGSSIPSGFTTLTGTWACDPTCGAYATALNANGFAALCDNTQTWAGAPDQSSEGVFTGSALASSYSHAPGIGVRLSATSGYFITRDASYVVLWKYVAGGVPYRPGITPYQLFSGGAKFRLSVVGNTLSVYLNDVLFPWSTGDTWKDTGTGSDAPITSGAPGLVTQLVGSSTTYAIDNWVGRGPATATIPIGLDSPSAAEHAVESAILSSKLDASSLLSLPFASAYVATLTGITIKALPAPTGVPNSLMMMGCGT